MTDIVKATVVLIGPVKNRLAERHDSSAKSSDDSQRAVAAPDGTGAGLAAGEDVPEVDEVHGRLDGVEEALGRGEAAVGVEGLPAVDVVDGAVQLVGYPEGPVQPAALHGVGAAEDVDGVPDDEGQREGQPAECEGRRGVAPGSTLAGPGLGRHG